MAIYKSPPKKEVYDLINQANPGLSKPVTEVNCVLGIPTVVPGAVFPAQNTSILVSPAPSNQDYIGKQTLKYNRRDLTKMFRGITVQVTKYATRSMPYYYSVAFTVYELLPDINKLYGLNLTQDDINDANITRSDVKEGGQYTNSVTVTTKGTSLAYIGSFTLKWINTPQSLKDMITNVDLDGRVFPGGNVFDETHKEVFSSQTFGLDASIPLNSSLVAFEFARQVISWNTWKDIYRNTVLPWLNNNIDSEITWIYDVSGHYSNMVGTIGGMEHSMYKLPNANFPEGNSKAYNWLLVIYIPEDCTWAAGNLYFHINR